MAEYAVWFNGKGKLPGLLSTVEKEYNKQIAGLRREAASFAKKKVRFWWYWYKCTGKGKWAYVCPVSSDPRLPLEREMVKLEAKKARRLEAIKGGVLAELGPHLVVDAAKLELPREEHVAIYDILRAMKEIKAREAKEEEKEWETPEVVKD